MSDKDKVMVERFDAEVALYDDMINKLGEERCEAFVWKASDIQNIMRLFQLKLKSYKELILWSQEKEI